MLLLAAHELYERGHEIVVVAVPIQRVDRADAEGFRALADKVGCPCLTISDLRSPEILDGLTDGGADVAVSVNWPTLVPQSVLDMFAHGVLNAHAGDLPRHRGNATIGWSILTGEREIVVTVHRMDADLDSGPVLAKRAYAMDETTYIADVYAFCELAVPEMFAEVIDGLARGTLVPAAQVAPPEAILRCFPRTPEDGWIDWSQDAVSIARLVRASSAPLDGAYTVRGDDRLTIWRAHAEQLAYQYLGVAGQVIELRVRTGEVAVLTGVGVLVLERVQSPDTTIVPAAECLRSTRLRLGMHVPTRVDDLSRRIAAVERRLGRGT